MEMLEMSRKAVMTTAAEMSIMMNKLILCANLRVGVLKRSGARAAAASVKMTRIKPMI